MAIRVRYGDTAGSLIPLGVEAGQGMAQQRSEQRAQDIIAREQQMDLQEQQLSQQRQQAEMQNQLQQLRYQSEQGQRGSASVKRPSAAPRRSGMTGALQRELGLSDQQAAAVNQAKQLGGTGTAQDMIQQYIQRSQQQQAPAGGQGYGGLRTDEGTVGFEAEGGEFRAQTAGGERLSDEILQERLGFVPSPAEAPQGQGQSSLTELGNAKLSAAQTLGVADLPTEQQEAISRMVQSDEVSVAQFRGVLSDLGVGDDGGGRRDSPTATSRLNAIEAQAEEAARTADPAEALGVSGLTRDEFVGRLAENVDASRIPMYGGSEEARRQAVLDDPKLAPRLRAFDRMRELNLRRDLLTGSRTYRTPNGDSVSNEDILDTAEQEGMTPQQVIEELGLQQQG